MTMTSRNEQAEEYYLDQLVSDIHRRIARRPDVQSRKYAPAPNPHEMGSSNRQRIDPLLRVLEKPSTK